MTALAKRDRVTGDTRTLVGHSLDVALSAQGLLSSPALRSRFESACGHSLSDIHIARLTILAGLHDAGKTCIGFQERISGTGPGTSHLAEILGALRVIPETQTALRIPTLVSWFSDPSAAIAASVCHHGGPVSPASISAALADARWQFETQQASGYSPIDALRDLANEMFTRFPAALSPAPAIQWTPSFDHLYAGVVMGADWMGSSLPVLGDEWRPDAVSALLDTLPWSPVIGAGEVESILPGAPRGAQSAISSVPLSDRLVVVEAPTGTGKTETAVMRGLALMKAGEVDGFYFAVPSRTAATELHARVARLVSSHSPALAGTVVRAVPGQIDTDPWQRSTDSWAIGCSKRVAYAPIAVGTIDQLMMSSLRTRHAWMRHTAFSRQLLIIDEVHASDPYMSEVVRVLVKRHLDLGGHALLMSATLGETLRADLHLRPRMDFASACAVPYPSVNGVPVSAPETRSAVSVLDYPGARAQVRECVVSQGGCALVIRSTVDTALQTFDELTAAGIPAILHHSRYADVDRRELDRRVMGVIGPGGSRTPVAIVSTQTCEQSLDIDADLLVSDPAPADVLLQRRGRLGRHRDGVFPMIVLDTGDIDAFYPTALRLAKGKPGRLPAGAQWAYVYDLVSTAASVEWLRGRTHLSIPDDVREWVEVATHPEALADFADSRGWGELFSETRGSASGLRQLASGVTLDWSRPYMEQPVQPDERVMTRLGEGSVTVELVTPLVSPVSGQKIHGIPVPWRWLRGVPPGTAGVAVGGVVTVGSVVLSYDGRGLSRT